MAAQQRREALVSAVFERMTSLSFLTPLAYMTEGASMPSVLRNGELAHSTCLEGLLNALKQPPKILEEAESGKPVSKGRMDREKQKIRNKAQTIRQYSIEEIKAEYIAALRQANRRSTMTAEHMRAGKALKETTLERIDQKVNELIQMAEKELPTFIEGKQRKDFQYQVMQRVLEIADERVGLLNTFPPGMERPSQILAQKAPLVANNEIPLERLQRQIENALPTGLAEDLAICKATYDAYLIRHACQEWEEDGKPLGDKRKRDLYQNVSLLGNVMEATRQAHARRTEAPQILGVSEQLSKKQRQAVISTAAGSKLPKQASENKSWPEKFVSELMDIRKVLSELYVGIVEIIRDDVVDRSALPLEKKNRELMLSLAATMDAVVNAFEELRLHCEHELGITPEHPAEDGGHAAIILSELEYRQFLARGIALHARIYAPCLQSMEARVASKSQAGEQAGKTIATSSDIRPAKSAQELIAELNALVHPAKELQSVAKREIERYRYAMSYLVETDSLQKAISNFEQAAEKFEEAIALKKDDGRPDFGEFELGKLEQGSEFCRKCVALYGAFHLDTTSQLPDEESLLTELREGRVHVEFIKPDDRTPPNMFEFILHRTAFKVGEDKIDLPPLYLHIHVRPGTRLSALRPTDITSAGIKTWRHRFYGKEYELRTGEIVRRLFISAESAVTFARSGQKLGLPTAVSPEAVVA